MEPLGFKQRKVLNKEPLKRGLQDEFIEPMLTLMHIYNGVNLDYKYETSTALKTKTEEMLCDVIMDNYINAELYKKGDKSIQHRLKEQHLELHPELYQEKIIKELHIITTILRHNGYKWVFSFADASQIIEVAHRCRTYAVRKKAHYKGFERFRYYTDGKPDFLTNNGLCKIKFSFDDVLYSIFYALLFADDDSFEISLYDPILDIEYYTTLGEVSKDLRLYAQAKLDTVRDKFDFKPVYAGVHKTKFSQPFFHKDTVKKYRCPCGKDYLKITNSVMKNKNRLYVRPIPSYICSDCWGKYELEIDNGITRWYIQERGAVTW